MFYSVFGWVYESILCSITEKKLINRGFLNGPYCPIYGFGAVFDLIILGRLSNPFVIFVSGAIVNCTLEYFTSWGMEKLFNARWWDYSNHKFNIHGRVCLLGAVVFGLFAVFLIKIVHPWSETIVGRINPVALHWAAGALCVAFIADIMVTLIGFVGFSSKLRQFSEELNHLREKSREQAAVYRETIAEKLKEHETRLPNIAALHSGFFKRVNHQERRILRSFPKFRSTIDNEVLSEIRARLLNRKNGNKEQ